MVVASYIFLRANESVYNLMAANAFAAIRSEMFLCWLGQAEK